MRVHCRREILGPAGAAKARGLRPTPRFGNDREMSHKNRGVQPHGEAEGSGMTRAASGMGRATLRRAARTLVRPLWSPPLSGGPGWPRWPAPPFTQPAFSPCCKGKELCAISSYRLRLDFYHEIPPGPYIRGPAAVTLERNAPLANILRWPVFLLQHPSQPLRVSEKRPRNLHFEQFFIQF